MRILYLALLILGVTGCSIPEPLLERIKDDGVLVVITRNSSTTYYEDKDGLKGFEYELVKQFADELGVVIRFVIPDRFEDIVPMVAKGEAHFAAAGLTVTDRRSSSVRFTPSYQQITQQLVYRARNRRPKKITDTRDGVFEVVAGSSHEEELQRLKSQFTDLSWISQRNLESEELLYLVWEQVIDYTIADSNELALNRRFYPELKVAFDLTEPQPLAWAFPHAQDSSLFNAASDFLHKQKKNGNLEQLIERYYGYVERLNFVDTRTFRRHIIQRLPLLTPYFKKAAAETGYDWRLLAAIGYQESHWNPDAVSPTGVRGIMMLTQSTARQLGINNRTDPEQSILGGARYVKHIENRVPVRIQRPDRLWLALAGYNVGYGHLEDARILTARNKKNPDKWADVKQHLPLLVQKKYYKTVKHGYARGRESVNFVDNIRNYYDMLVWHNKRQEQRPTKKAEIPMTAPAVL